MPGGFLKTKAELTAYDDYSVLLTYSNGSRKVKVSGIWDIDADCTLTVVLGGIRYTMPSDPETRAYTLTLPVNGKEAVFANPDNEAMAEMTLYVRFNQVMLFPVNNGRHTSLDEAAYINNIGVPDKYEIACAEKETVTELTYTVSRMDDPSVTAEKTAYVYLPAGYDPSMQYNVLYLLHGRAGMVENPTTVNSNGNIRRVSC